MRNNLLKHALLGILVLAFVSIAGPVRAVILKDQQTATSPKYTINAQGLKISNAQNVPASQGYIIQLIDDSIVTHMIKFQKDPANSAYLSKASMLSERLSYKQRLLGAHAQLIQNISQILSQSPASGTSVNQNFKIRRHFTNVLNGFSMEVSGISKADEKTFIDQVKQISGVKSVSRNMVVKAEMYQSVPLIQANQVWQLNAQGTPCAAGQACITGQGVTIGIIDTGIDYTNPELGGCTALGPNCHVAGGYNFISDGATPPMDDFGHGTDVASIAAGIGASSGYVNGVAPGAAIYAIKVLDSTGTGTFDNIIAGIEWAMDPNGDGNFDDHLNVINLSLGSDCSGTYSIDCGPLDPLSISIDNAVQAGIVAVVAAGNSGPWADTIDSPGVSIEAITVGASDKSYSYLTSYSSQGPVDYTDENGNKFILNKPDVLAPGNLICAAKASGLNPELNVPCVDASGNTIYPNHIMLSGTSLAAPHVAGLAALLIQAHPDWTPDQIKMDVKNSAVSVAGTIDQEGQGGINALNAVQWTNQDLAIIDPGNVYLGDETVNITGTANGPAFTGYTLSYQLGDISPFQTNGWTTICSGNQPVTNGTLCSWNINSNNQGVYTLRLQVGSTVGYNVLRVQNTVITAPQASEGLPGYYGPYIPLVVYPGWNNIPVNGTAGGLGFQSYTLSLCAQTGGICYPKAISLVNAGQSTVVNGLLGTIDPTQLPQVAPAFYVLTLTSSIGISESKLIYIDPTIKQGWPQQLFSAFQEGSHLYFGFGNLWTAADLNNDGKKELVIGYAQTVTAADSNGVILPGWPVTLKDGGMIQQSSPAVGDLLGDGQHEIVIGDSAGYLNVFKKDGTYLFPPVYLQGGTFDQITSQSLADINNDGADEIIVTNQNGNVFLVSPQGEIIWDTPLAPYPGYTALNTVAGGAIVGDMANDGHKEIFVVTASCTDYCWRQSASSTIVNQYWLLNATDGSVLPGWPKVIPNGTSYPLTGVMASMNKSSQLAVIAMGQGSSITGPSGSGTGYIYGWNQDGSNVPGFPIPTGANYFNTMITSLPAAADLAHDGNTEIIITGDDVLNGKQSCLFVYKSDGTSYPNFPICSNPQASNSYNFEGPVTIGYLNSQSEEIITTEGQVEAVDKNGAWVQGFPKQTSLYDAGYPVIADLDGSGSNELIEGTFYNLQEASPQVYVWNLNTSSGKDSWPMFNHDPQQSGVFVDNINPIPAIINPVPNSTLTSTTVNFQWSAGVGVTEYQLLLGSTVGGMDIYHGLLTKNLSIKVLNIPLNGSNVYATLRYLTGGKWVNIPYTYETVLPSDAQITSPAPNSTLNAYAQTFQWNTGVGVTEYRLQIGTSAGGINLYNGQSTVDLNSTVSNLPMDGQPLYVRLSSYILGQYWQYQDFVYQTEMIAPTVPSGLKDISGDAQVVLSWQTSSGATSYNIKRSTVSGGPYNKIGTSMDETYKDQSVSNGTTYYYVVSAINAMFESANSGEVVATPNHPAFEIVNAYAAIGGKISPSGSVNVKYGTNQTFNITPELGYNINQVMVDRSVVTPVPSTYTFDNVTAEHAISANFIPCFEISVNAGPGGTVSPPSGCFDRGDAQIFTIIPNKGFSVGKVLVDGTAVKLSSTNTYTFKKVNKAHKINVSFKS